MLLPKSHWNTEGKTCLYVTFRVSLQWKCLDQNDKNEVQTSCACVIWEEVDQLYQGSANINSNVADIFSCLVGQENGRGLPPTFCITTTWLESISVVHLVEKCVCSSKLILSFYLLRPSVV